MKRLKYTSTPIQCTWGNHLFTGGYDQHKGTVNGVRFNGVICENCTNKEIRRYYADMNEATSSTDYEQYGR